MYPVVLGNPRVTSYGLMLVLAWGVAWCLARKRAVHLDVPAYYVDGLMPLLLLSMMSGARLAGWLVQPAGPDFANDHLLFGGLVAAALVVVAVGRVTGTPLGRLADTFAFALPAGIGLLRAGCLLAGCCWGTVCSHRWPLAVTYPQGSPAYYQHLLGGQLAAGATRSLPVHPVPLYELAGVLAWLATLWLLDRRWTRWGESFLASGLGYTSLRFGLEYLRADQQFEAGGLTNSQWACLALAAICLATGARRRSQAAHGRTELYRHLP